MIEPKRDNWTQTLYWEVTGKFADTRSRVELDPETGDVSLIGIPSEMSMGTARQVAQGILHAYDYYYNVIEEKP